MALFENIFPGRTEEAFTDGEARGILSWIELKRKFQIESLSRYDFS